MTIRTKVSVVGVLVVLLGATISYITHVRAVAYSIMPHGVVYPVRTSEAERGRLRRMGDSLLPEQRFDTTFAQRTDDSTTIVVRHIRPVNVPNPRGLVVIVHGISSCKEVGLFAAARLLEKQYEVVVYDQRGHGESSGTTCTYGYRESQDLVLILQNVVQRRSLPIVLWGNSMGAATVILAAERLQRVGIPPSCVIAESGYSDFTSLVADFTEQRMGYRLPGIGSILADTVGRLLNFSPDSIRPVESLARIQCPVILLHGTADTRVPIDHGRRLAEALHGKHTKSSYIEFVGAGHTDLASVNPRLYADAISAGFNIIGR
ncbi:MAG TPA: alpha/beta fold hydrolase [Chlorobiota bacterium]|nr:alpha/beta fold hydrolase [Chlorobiota bacterium]